jgi:glycosyltransferase involved in cell wall biosynthesis
MLISIVIATKNSERTLSRCLESILNQDQHNFEVLVQDGCSTDRTLEILAGFLASSDRLVVSSEPDNGIYDAVNKAIRRSQAEWVYVLGSDDWLHDNSVLADVGHFLAETPCDLVYGDVVLTGDSPLGRSGSRYRGAVQACELVESNICQQAIFYRRSSLVEFGLFDTRFQVCADWAVNLKYFAKGEPVYYDRAVACFSTGGASKNVDRVFLEEFCTIILQSFPEGRRGVSMRNVRKAYLAFAFAKLRNGHWIDALRAAAAFGSNSLRFYLKCCCMRK